MEKYYRKNYIKNNDSLDVFQIIDIMATDCNINEDDDTDNCMDLYTIRMSGVNKDGVSISCRIDNFTPFYYIKVKGFMKNGNIDRVKLNSFLDYVENNWTMKKKVDEEYTNYYGKCLLRNKCKVVIKKDIYGFRNDKEYEYIRLTFNNYSVLKKSKYIFKKPVVIKNVNTAPIKFKLYESNFEPYLRFCHLKNIKTAGWVKMNNFVESVGETTTMKEYKLDWKDIESLPDNNDLANFLQMSWDIETYSFDNNFPDPNAIDTNAKSSLIEKKYPNVIYQIGNTFKYINDKYNIQCLLTLKKCNPIDNVIVEEFKTEKDLIIRWMELVSLMDPDIMYTYNGDEFDCRYVFERAKLYNLASGTETGRKEWHDGKLFDKLSRLENIPASIKHEVFSSSAYGDSEYKRFYIPGRLNYDLLIHYKRGMTKYSSYKLDFIAKEILNVGKHEVSVKQIFSYYKEGDPEKIKIIGQYCQMDTELLQMLVDKQLILLTIIQLANVTYVPIGFLSTKGQTIKVFSQLLRKAKEMDYLVPDTNFNEDNYGISVKTRNPHDLDDYTGEYIEIECGKYKTTNGFTRPKIINGKIIEIISDNEFIISSDTEIDKPYNNLKYKFQNKYYETSSIIPIDDLVDDSFTGATVLTAIPGLYKENIHVLDFASLYPTIMISRNLCFSTFVIDPKYNNIPGVEYERFQWDDKIEYKLNHMCEAIGKSGASINKVCGKQAYFDVSYKDQITNKQNEIEDINININDTTDKKVITSEKAKLRTRKKDLVNLQSTIDLFNDIDLNKGRYYCRTHDPLKSIRLPEEKFQKKDVTFDYTVVQPSNGKHKGVVPALLEELYTERKRVKKQMAIAAEKGDKLLADILDATQLSIKISLNSCYGFLGRKQGNLILKELGSIVTSTGRSLIEQSKNYAENVFPDYVKEHNTISHQIEYKNYLVKTLTEQEKNEILTRYHQNLI